MQETQTQGRHSGRLFPFLGPLLGRALALGFAGLVSGAAHAGDRPYLATTTATSEPDDDNVWAMDTVVQRLGGLNNALINAEYAFDPLTTVQLSAARSREQQGLSVEFKRLFNNYAREDWGWGLSIELGASKAEGLRWRGGDVAVTLPLSWKVSNAIVLHASVGLEKERGQERERVLATAAEWAFTRQGTLFAELARVGEATQAQLGLRWWLKREKLAVDIAAVRSRADGSTERGFVLGLTLQDL